MPTPRADNAQITRDRDRAFPKEEAEAIQGHRLYAQGKKSALVLTTRERVYLEGIINSRFTDNICNLIIATASDRLILQRLKVDDERTQEWLDRDLYIKCRLGDVNGETHYATLRDGNYCLMPWWSKVQERLIILKKEWWDGNYGMFVCYDGEDQIKYAVEEWTDAESLPGTPIKRRDVWFDGQVERYELISAAKEWTPFTYPGESGPVIELMKAGGAPLGIPVVHFANGGRGPVNYGVSELDGGPEGFQDQIDHLHYSITMTARNTGFQQTYSTGVSKAIGEDGKEIVIESGPGVHWMGPEGATFGYIPAGSISEQVNAYELKRGSMCQMTRTPLHYITGIWPSGEALFRAELPLTDKVTKQKEKVSPSWGTLGHRATEIANVFGKAGLNEDAMIEAEFMDIERRDPFTIAAAEQAEANAIKAWVEASVPLVTVLRRKGWTEEELTKLAEEQEAESKSGADATDRALAAFERGR